MGTQAAPASISAPYGARVGSPTVKQLVRFLAERGEERACLLAVCPNSETVVRSALQAANEVDAPILFAATLNQVDTDGGYTGWTPHALVEFIAQESGRLQLRVPVLPCLDHGGPWLKDLHSTLGYSFRETLDAVKQSLEACIDAGYALLHIDPTVDRTLPAGAPIPVELVVERTIELIEHAENYRKSAGREPIDYEVGTEEVHGGLADIDHFRSFLKSLDAGLRRLNLQEAWPVFVVGKVGTDLHTDLFDPEMARCLTDEVRPFGARIKGHYTDYVANPEAYPIAGMGAANVGPEFTDQEYRALMDLVELERKVGADSGFERVLRDAVIGSGRWQKWLGQKEAGLTFEALDETRQKWLVATGSRYVWTEPDVVEARGRLYHNVRHYRDGDAYVLWKVKTSIIKYFHAFNLVGFAEKYMVASDAQLPKT